MTPAARRMCLVPVLLAGLVYPPRAGAQESDVVTRLRDRIQHFIDEGQISGAVVLSGGTEQVYASLGPDGQLLGIANADLAAVGLRNIDLELPMHAGTLFRIASMTKPITAIGVMMLADDGKLSVDDPVEKHLPEFTGQMLVAERSKDTVTLRKPARPITLRDLLTHTSGMPGSPPPGLSDLYARRNHTLAEAVMAYSQRPLDFEPGTRWSYCNVGIDTLGRVIEAVSGQPYEVFLKQRLFDPLGMHDTTFYPTEDQLRRSAVTYDLKDGHLEPVAASITGPPRGAKYPTPAGGLYSTALDLAKVYQMMLKRGVYDHRRYLSKASVEEMTRVQTGDLKAGFTEGTGWGLGWGVVREPKGVTATLSPGSYGHGGAWGTQAWIDPEKDRFVVILFQRAGLKNSDESEVRRSLQDAAFGAKR